MRDQLNGFYTKMNFKNIKPLYIVAAILILFNFSFFRWSNHQSEKKVQQAVQSLLRNESLIANSYALSKSIVDLEKIGIIRCSELVEDFTEKRVFSSTLNQNYCYQSKLLKLISETSFKGQAVNGLGYKITLQLNIPWQSIILECLLDFLLVLGGVVLSRYLQKQEEIAFARAKAVEIEKQMLIDKTKQIRHDVASPIAAMKSFLDLLSDSDEEVKEIFKRAIDRTQELFNQLNASTNISKQTPCFIQQITEEIVKEKKMTIKDGVEFIFKGQLKNETQILVHEMEFKRLLSNLLNNASEACADRPVKKVEILLAQVDKMVEIKITDSGKGIPQQVIDKLGTKGFSYGKENHQTAGSGLGLYHAMTSVKSWGGDFIISSQEGQGTTMTIKLPR